MVFKPASPRLTAPQMDRHHHSASPGYPSPASSASSTFNCVASESLSYYNAYSTSLAASTPGSSAVVSPAPLYSEPWTAAPVTTNTLMSMTRAEDFPTSFLPNTTSSEMMPWDVPAYSTPSGIIAGNMMSGSHLYSPGSSSNGCEPQTPIKDESEWMGRSPMMTGEMLVNMKRNDSMTISPQHLSNLHSSNVDYPYGSPLSNPEETMLPSVSVGLGIHSLLDPAPGHPIHMHVDHAAARGLRRISDTRVPSANYPRRRRTNRTRSVPENGATCEICGRGFQREYNRKTHMDTHNPQRQKAHICTWDNCGRSFVRRTDLNRHQESVHIKARPFGCDACDARFSRRDTLQRHMEDGCPRRFDVGAQNSLARRLARRYVH